MRDYREPMGRVGGVRGGKKLGRGWNGAQGFGAVLSRHGVQFGIMTASCLEPESRRTRTRRDDGRPPFCTHDAPREANVALRGASRAKRDVMAQSLPEISCQFLQPIWRHQRRCLQFEAV